MHGIIERTDDPWVEGEPGATIELIRDNVDDILSALEPMLRHDGRDVGRLPHHLHWLLWLLDEIEVLLSA